MFLKTASPPVVALGFHNLPVFLSHHLLHVTLLRQTPPMLRLQSWYPGLSEIPISTTIGKLMHPDMQGE